MGLKVGAKVPDFSLKDQHGEWFHLQDYLGKKPLVVFFYPKDYTPGCTKEVCSFRDSYEEFTELGAEVVGISSDSERMHRSFAKQYKLPFLLLADSKGIVRKKFQVEGSFLNLLPGRETFVINTNGRISMSFNSVSAKNHMKNALDALKRDLGI